MDINTESTHCPPSSKLSHCPAYLCYYKITLTSLDVSFLQGCLPKCSSSSSSSAFLFLFFSVLPANSRDHILRHLPKQRAKLKTGVTTPSPSAKHSFGRILTASTKPTGFLPENHWPLLWKPLSRSQLLKAPKSRRISQSCQNRALPCDFEFNHTYYGNRSHRLLTSPLKPTAWSSSGLL